MKKPQPHKMIQPEDLETKYSSSRWRWNGNQMILTKIKKKKEARKRAWRQDERKKKRLNDGI